MGESWPSYQSDHHRRQGEVFALQFTFEPEYPISSPEVVFVADNGYQTPVHPHVYSNGHVSCSHIPELGM